MTMRAACLIATLIFALFSYLQLNDAEQYGTRLWLGWVLLYASAAIISLVSAREALPRPLYLGAALFAGIAACLRFAAIDWSSAVFYNETNPAGNETGGLLILALWFALLAWRLPPRL